MAVAGNLPVILIEVVLVFGGTLLFGWWQLRSVRRDRELLRERRAREAAEAAEAAADENAPPTDPPSR